MCTLDFLCEGLDRLVQGSKFSCPRIKILDRRGLVVGFLQRLELLLNFFSPALQTFFEFDLEGIFPPFQLSKASALMRRKYYRSHLVFALAQLDHILSPPFDFLPESNDHLLLIACDAVRQRSSQLGMIPCNLCLQSAQLSPASPYPPRVPKRGP